MDNSPYKAARVVRQAKSFAIAKVLSACVAVLFQFLLVRHLSVLDYVSFTVLTAANGILVFATMFGMDRLVYRLVPPLRDAGRWREMAALMGGLLLLRQLTIALLLGGFVWLGAWLLPAQIYAETCKFPWHYAWYAVAVGCTDSLAIFCNSVGLQGRQATLLTGMTSLRLLACLLLQALFGGLLALDVGRVLIGTEFLLAAALLLLLGRELAEVRRSHAPPGAWKFGFHWGELVRDSISTQLTYMLTLPFRGGVLKLVVAAVATPLVTASFGFFQTIADRAYQFMPIFMMKGMLEPALASDYAVRRDPGRIQLSVSLLLRMNFLILALALALLLGCGGPLIDWVTNGRYGGELLVAGLLLVQLGAMTVGEGLWISLNPVGRIALHNRIWLWVALLCYLLIAAAAWLRSSELIILGSALPYALVFAWLRWAAAEPMVQDDLGLRRMWRLALPVGAAALAARAVLLAGGGHALVVLAVLAGAGVFLLGVRRARLFQPAELDGIGSVSPKLARLLKYVSPAAGDHPMKD